MTKKYSRFSSCVVSVPTSAVIRRGKPAHAQCARRATDYTTHGQAGRLDKLCELFRKSLGYAVNAIRKICKHLRH
ncbi:unnamed protein product [Plutella xylostella]|uniref:(diamondback moth) hypothetical protein n=1 Tax=Plutella xylostella TaxID=51655 RepID=A0A8S4ELV4_PLUXY|nr:unnamed protein product [Plutella xylostella]